MKRNAFLSRLVTMALVCVIAAGPLACASTTQFSSEPSGASVRVDNIPIGQTPIGYSDGSVWVWTKHHVSVEKSGYRTQVSQIKGELVATNVVLGAVFFFCFFPMAWIAAVGEFRPQYHFVLQRKQALESASLVETPLVDFAQ